MELKKKGDCDMNVIIQIELTSVFDNGDGTPDMQMVLDYIRDGMFLSEKDVKIVSYTKDENDVEDMEAQNETE